MTSAAQQIVAVERFDVKKLTYIVNNWDELPFERKTDDALRQLKKYLGKGMSGRITAKYVQKDGLGRHCAKDQMSQQNIIREVRHTIAGHLYEDIDIVNSAPTTLEQYCRKNGINCPILAEYVNERESLLKDLEDATGVSRDDAKTGIISIMNGGRCFPNVAPRSLPAWVLRFKEEMEAVRDHVYDTEAVYADAANKKAEKKTKAGEWVNPKGSAMCLLLHDIENKVLIAMRDYLINDGIITASKGEYVLVFDGIQVLKTALEGRDLSDVMAGMETYALQKTGYVIQLKAKAMDQVIPLPDELTVEDKKVTIITDDENEASILFLQEVADDVRKCQGVIFVRQNGIWTSDSTEVEDYLLDRCLDMNFMKLNDKGQHVKYSSKVSGASNIVRAAKARMRPDPDFITKLSRSNRGKLVFMDGYYDFDKGEFIKGFDGVESTIQIKRPFPKREKIRPEVAKRVLEQVLDDIFGMELRTAFLEFLARAMAGRTQDKKWAVMMGERDSGKGVMGALLKAAFGDYVTTIVPDSLLCQRLSHGDQAKLLSWTTVMEFTRLAITNEVKYDKDSNIKLDGNMLKKISGGPSDLIMARTNYKDEREFTVQATLLMCCNDLPPVSPADAYSTCVPINCPHKFVDKEVIDKMGEDEDTRRQYAFLKEKDDSVKDFCMTEEAGDAFLFFVLDHYRNHAVKLTADMRSFLEDFQEEDEMKVLSNYFHVTGKDEDFISVKDVENLVKSLDVNITLAKFRSSMKRRGMKTGEKRSVKVEGQETKKQVKVYSRIKRLNPCDDE